MPNHVHLLVTQFVPLAKWLGPLKGFTANQAKKALGLRDRAFWQNESYDHLMRSENPVKAGCVQRPEQFRWLSAVAAWKGG
jgi:REP element-mobilizing transposase RayT